MFNKYISIFVHQMGDLNFYSMYKRLLKSQWKSYDELKIDQEKQLRHMVHFAYENVPYYHNLFKDLNLRADSIKKVEDLEKLPILNKDIIKQNWEYFKPLNLGNMKYYIHSTGGSTGTPFQYRLLKLDRFLSGAMMYRGWGYGGYELGDKMVFLAGSSLDVGANSFIVKKVHEITRNIRKLSSFDMGYEDMYKYAGTIQTFNPKSIRGYASSINLFGSFVKDNAIDLPDISAIYTTAEKLLPHMRDNIEDAFDCDVYDTYGLNDGGVGAYECFEHTGLHIDTERSIMEIVDDDGYQMSDGIGNILATSLYNYAMPFIRYDTGDMGHIIDDQCGCGRKSKLLKEVIGRSVDILITPEGKKVHGYFLLYIFWEYGAGIENYQVIQNKINNILIKIVPTDHFDVNNLSLIRNSIKAKSASWNVDFEFVDSIEKTKAGKYKFILNQLEPLL
ncbi:phenylacetate--CoA ligase family protein [Methanococcoides methylutens]|uniref:Capsular polysaccharide biosynthesis protein n=1 Tax=Methanococcoides methylutens MM1 TaxID=1434104 RepID=A0A0E3SQF4_METMT|nr:phenylacetate--CoA ligase family protein [Methanococcoides methylutens]AKB84293.1 capsular polysaccharide biosynthesis protein [Methanococcoides methylutens MM1]